MFTGIVEEIGTVRSIKRGAVSAALTVKAHRILSDLHIGDSIAVNGVCLTVTSFTDETFTEGTFTADVMHETLRRSDLGSLRAGSRVNLERAMPAAGRFGGHLVSGHIDGTGTITSVRRDGNAVWYTIRASDSILRCIVEKGSVAIDGISLTVAAVCRGSFQVSVIPHTLVHTALSLKRENDAVNLENDCIAKYVEKLLFQSGGPSGGSPARQSGMTRDWLAECGFQEG